MPNLLRLVCSACDAPFMAQGTQSCSLPICGRCQRKANALLAITLTGLSSHEQRALAQSIVKQVNQLRKGAHVLANTATTA